MSAARYQFQPMVIPTSSTPKATLAPLSDMNGNITPGSSYNSQRSAIYRGANIEDLQLPPAFALSKNKQVMDAINLAYDREFSYIPILDRNRRPLGYIDVSALKRAWEAGQVDAEDPVIKLATKFDRSSDRKRPYLLITPDTPLEVLEEFLQTNEFAIVTDHERKFVLGVATSQDLENFVTRRGKHAI